MRPKDLEMDRLIQQLIILLSEKSHSLIIHRQHSVNCTFWRMFASPFFTQAVLSQTEPQGRTVAGENGGGGGMPGLLSTFPGVYDPWGKSPENDFYDPAKNYLESIQ